MSAQILYVFEIQEKSFVDSPPGQYLEVFEKLLKLSDQELLALGFFLLQRPYLYKRTLSWYFFNIGYKPTQNRLNSPFSY